MTKDRNSSEPGLLHILLAVLFIAGMFVWSYLVVGSIFSNGPQPSHIQHQTPVAKTVAHGTFNHN